jgi:ankyrin repeat protein
MLQAIHEDDAAALKEIYISSPGLVNKQLIDGSTPLHVACSVGAIEVTKLLFERGSDLIAMDRSQRMPLHCAVEKAQIETVDIMMNKLESKGWAVRMINTKDVRGMDCLHLAAPHSKILKRLLKAQPQLDGQQKNSLNTPLIIACCSGSEESVQALCEAGSDVNTLNAQKRHALSCASENGLQTSVEILCKHGADIAVQDEDLRSCKTKQNKNIRTEGTTGTTGGVLSIRRVCRGWEKRLFSTRQPTPLKHLATNAW